jgi:hypothetical protein
MYIEADHTYQDVCKDIQQRYQKVKTELMRVFNDYTNGSVWEIAIDRAENSTKIILAQPDCQI